MGYLDCGTWVDKWYDTNAHKGAFKREDSQFRSVISEDHPIFKPDLNRYHLYISYACPWAHRTLIFRQLKQLNDVVSVSVVDPVMLEHGWVFNKRNPDHLYNVNFLHQIYSKSNPEYVGRVTVPVLWDKQTNQIVNNESSDIIRIFNEAFNNITKNSLDFYPEELRDDINKLNDLIYHTVNNGVYKAGFATSQLVYEHAVKELFSTLDQLDELLEKQQFLVGNQLTEADWRFFTTLIRFDSVYVGHFKCNIRRIKDYKSLPRYIDRVRSYYDIEDTINMHHIKHHYYGSHETLNPSRIVPTGPVD